MCQIEKLTVSRRLGSAAIQVEVDGDGGCDINWLAVEEIGTVMPFVDGLHGWIAKALVSLDHVDSFYRAIPGDDGLHYDRSLDSGDLRAIRIGGNARIDEMGFHYGGSDPDGSCEIGGGYAVWLCLVGLCGDAIGD